MPSLRQITLANASNRNKMLLPKFLTFFFWLTCFHYVSPRKMSEPQCSPYDFFERTIDKVIRVEHANENQKEKLEKLEEQMNEKIRELDQKIEDERRLVGELRDSLAEQKSKDVDESKTKTVVTKGSAIAFTATKVSKTLVKGRAVFNSVITNVGGDFDKTTGQFTCRVPGLYSFTVTLLVYNNAKKLYCRLCLKGRNILYVGAYPASVSNIDSGTVQAYLQLTEGDVVDVCDCYNWRYIDGGIMTSFSGVLITPA